jgi:uncharacterized protein (AIM24 family)
LRFNSFVVSPARDREALDQAVLRGSELLKLGQLDEAQRAFRSALALEPDNARVLALLGLSHFRANEFADARDVYEQLVDRAPTDASHRLNLGLVYLKLNDADHAISALEASRALDPSAGRAVSYLGLAYARAGRYAEAYRAFLLAGQNDLAIEIEVNLTAAERDRIHAQIGRTPQGAHDPATAAPSVPRTKPPGAPPKARPSQEIPVVAAPELSPPTSDGRHSDSMQFVLPRADPAARPTPIDDGASMISRAVTTATPSPVAGPRTKAGGFAPRPLSELATDDLVRPDDGDDAFELGTGGALIIRVGERMMTRLDGVHITGGDLAYEAAMRRSRGHNTDEPFAYGGSPLHAVTGRGYLIAAPGEHAFNTVLLDDDILYLREDLVFAFQASLRWENGNVPGLRGKLPVVQFRGHGALTMRLVRPLVRVKLPAQGTVFVDADRLAGWIGRVIPRAVVPPPGGPLGAMCVECTGEGIVLVEPAPQISAVASPPPPPAAAPSPPPPVDSPPAASDETSFGSVDDGDTLDRLDEL